ncbi:HVO_A0114 family putative DNA-binding protein [Candidatus Nanohalobium constans]|uniref:HTH domain protein n=1 Tax=Candidatus Nanohalobium constans TaxID=2565781 RepID=A0A5Q0UFQ8_9ARCH|nr:transcriptional regulator [Candidatus Nanohalobium constans]QGA80030.1 HTH domain protein [Candidatus Nanohalobium constans]
MSNENRIEREIPYGKKLVIKERNLEQAVEDMNQQFESFIEDGEESGVVVGFEDPEKIRQILTPKRRELMSAIISAEPESISQLADITDRGITEVHRDLEILKENKLVYIEGEEVNGKAKKPVVPYSDIEINYNLKSSLMSNKEVKDFKTA